MACMPAWPCTSLQHGFYVLSVLIAMFSASLQDWEEVIFHPIDQKGNFLMESELYNYINIPLSSAA